MVEALGSDADQLIVQAMTTPGVDLRIHCEHDERLGVIVSVGLGGAQADVIADRTSRLAPVSPAVAATMLDETRIRAGARRRGHRSVADRRRDRAGRAARLRPRPNRRTRPEPGDRIGRRCGRHRRRDPAERRPTTPIDPCADSNERRTATSRDHDPSAAPTTVPHRTVRPMRTLACVTVGIIVPLIVIPIAVIVAYLWYRRKMSAHAASTTDAREVPGVRLTSETLRRLPAPAVAGRLRDPTGPARGRRSCRDRTVRHHRPHHRRRRSSSRRSSPVCRRSSRPRASCAPPSTNSRRPVGVRCDRVVKVYWGAPQPDRPPAREGINGAIDVEGQRLEAWLHSLPPGPLASDAGRCCVAGDRRRYRASRSASLTTARRCQAHDTGGRFRSVAVACRSMATPDEFTGPTTELLQSLIRNQCVNDGTPGLRGGDPQLRPADRLPGGRRTRGRVFHADGQGATRWSPGSRAPTPMRPRCA